MTATITYGSVAWLAARLQRRRLSRWITLCLTGSIITLICLSRLYLGVHYPSDVVAGALMGLGWTAACMVTLEGIQVFGRRFRPQILEHEEPAPALDAEPSSLKSASA
jgi:membrane-associated phospholipid phosphatase